MGILVHKMHKPSVLFVEIKPNIYMLLLSSLLVSGHPLYITVVFMFIFTASLSIQLILW